MKEIKETRKVPSPIPYIITAGIFVLGTFVLKMYKLYSYVILIMICGLSYFIIKKLDIFKDETEEIIHYENDEVNELHELGIKKIERLKELVLRIENDDLIHDINMIIQTSEDILDLLVDNQQSYKKIKKYFTYYLEEVIHLVYTYDDLEEDPENLEEVKVSKKQIERTINIAKTTFSKLYDDLYDGKAMNISVDVKVFEDMLKRID
jgi:hypothetical protein